MKKSLLQITFLLTTLLLLSSGNILGQLNGTYYIGAAGTGPGGSDPTYATLKAACDDLNTHGISGNCTFLITSNLTESANIGLGVNTGTYTITFKPYTDTDMKISFTTTGDNAGPSGNFCIGIGSGLDWSDITQTDNIIIDGYASGHTTRRLTFENVSGGKYWAPVILIVGNSNHIIVKNTIVNQIADGSGTSVSRCIGIRSYEDGDGNDFIPDYITIQNNQLTANSSPNATGVGHFVKNSPETFASNIEVASNIISVKGYGVDLSATQSISVHNNVINANNDAYAMGIKIYNASYASGYEVRDNIITTTYRGIWNNGTNNYDFYDNEIKVEQSATGIMSSGIHLGSGDPIKIYNNKITQLINANSDGGDYGVAGIYFASSYSATTVYNNMISGFATTGSDPGRLQGIRQPLNGNQKIYNNTIWMDDVTTATAAYCGIYVNGTGTNTLKNNIVFLDEDDFDGYCVYDAGTTTLVSDYNDWFVKDVTTGFVGFQSVNCQTLASWQSQTSQDANSVARVVDFVDELNGDLHLTGTSIGDADLAGVALAAVTTDIDGDTRNDPPYMGADENSTPAPVELTTFSAKIVEGGVMLNWSTATEVNNYGFEIEKSVNGGEWEYVDFVEGHGNSNSPQEYSYFDDAAIEGKVAYRLKQVDNNGDYEYSSEVSVLSDEAVYKLNQNYPNPFNPTTVISFSLKASSKITLTVYNALGQEVAVLANEVMDAGYHEVTFDASSLASGFYVYRLDAPGFSKTMKMMLLK